MCFVKARGNPLALIELPLGWREGRTANDAHEFSLTTRLRRSFAARARSLPAIDSDGPSHRRAQRRRSPRRDAAGRRRVHPSESALKALEVAERARLVAIDNRSLRFSHPLIRAAIRQAASSGEHRTAHAALAQALVDEPERAVWHAAATAVAPDEMLAGQLESTARSARQHRGTRVAFRALLLAAELSDSQESRGERLISAAELALELGEEQELERLIDRVRTLRLRARDERRLLWLTEALAEASGAATAKSMLALAGRLTAMSSRRRSTFR